MDSCKKRGQGEEGLSLLGVLIALVLLSFIGLAMVKSSINSYFISTKLKYHTTATALARDELESIYIRGPGTLTGADSYAGVVTRNGVDFQRAVTITIEPDGARRVEVEVQSVDTGPRGAQVELEMTFAPGGAL